MTRRIEIELTSDRGDGTWTWRAAGAREPKGVLLSKVLFEGAKTGDVCKADAEFGMDGIDVVSVSRPAAQKSSTVKRIELVGKAPKDEQLVTTSLVEKRGGRGGKPGSRDARDSRDSRDSRPRDGKPGGPGARDGKPGGPGARDGKPGGPGARDGRPGGPGARDSRSRDAKPSGPGARDRGAPRGDRARPDQARPPRLNTGTKHRDAALEGLATEQRAVADLLARGGIPNVRLELEKANTAAKAEGRPETPAAPMLKLADEMWPSIKLALWRDRVDAVLADLENVGLRDLRAVVSESESVARDDETRLLGAQLREALEKRTLASRDAWNAEIDEAIVEGRIVRALRLSVRAPDPATRLDADRAKKLADAASAAMTPDIDSDRWLALLEAVAASPVRRLVKPVALPTEPTEALVHLATQESSRIPALVQMLGLKMPPPPRPPQGRPGANLARPKQRKTSGPTPNPLRLAKPAVSAATSAAAKVAEIAHDVADVAQAVVDKVETVAHNVVEEVAEIIDNAREAGHEAVEDLKEQAAQTRIDLDVAVLEARGVEPEAPEAPVAPTAEAVVDAPADTDPSSVPDETPST